MGDPERKYSIDIFRATTMWLMIFVNDLWTLESYPKWLGHARAGEDYLGLADVVFPAFLFIVGLSIPYAIQSRKNKGQTFLEILRHIIQRTFALVVMGFFMVNLENLNQELTPISKSVWMFLMALSFVLIWNRYGTDKEGRNIPAWVFKLTGWLILFFLAWIYTGGSIEDPKGMQPYWWGILGLIGWAYLVCATIYLLSGGRLWIIGLATPLLLLLNISEYVAIPVISDVSLIIGASNHTSVIGGVLISMIFIQAGQNSRMMIGLLFGVAMIAAALVTRPEWGISKLGGTPSWTMICLGISTLSFVGLYFIADKRGYTGWADFVKPAGTSTLTCYLIPYFYYALLTMIGIYLPEFIRSGYLGILKSVGFGILIIQITGLLERRGVSLKI